MAWPRRKFEPLGPPRERTPKLDKVGEVYSPPRPRKEEIDGFYYPNCDHKKPTQLRFLVSDTEANRLSREHMSNGRKSQFHMFGACVQLSAPDELFPGTDSRIVMVSGFFYGTSLALDWLFVFLRSHLRYGAESIRLIVPDRFCHVLTGKDNVILMSLIEKSSTQIVVSPPNRYVVGLDRPVIVLGSHVDSGFLLNQRLAIRFILSKLTEEPCYPLDLASPYSYAGLKTKQTHIRFLVSPAEVETLMFYYGSKSNELEFSLWGANVDLSREHEVFPGTSDRMVMVSGTCYNITVAVLGLSELLQERQDTTKIRLIIPDKSYDVLCGKGGASMKSIMERSKAVIRVSPPDHNYVGLDRLVTISGSGSDCYEKQMDAVHSILSKLTDDACYPSHLKSPYTYADYLEEHAKPLDGGLPEEDRPTNEEMSEDDSKSNNDEAIPDSECVRPYDSQRKNARNDKPEVTCKYNHHKTSKEETQNQARVLNEIGNTSSWNLSRSSGMYASVCEIAKDAFDFEVKYKDGYMDGDLRPSNTGEETQNQARIPNEIGNALKYKDDYMDGDLGPANTENHKREVEKIPKTTNSDVLSIFEILVPGLINGNGSFQKYPEDSQYVRPSDHEKKKTRNEQPKVTWTNDVPKIKTSEEEAKNQSTVCNEIRKMYGSAKDTPELHREEHISRRSRLSSDLLSTERSTLGLIDGNVSPWKYTGTGLHDAPAGTLIPDLRDCKIMDLLAW